MTKLAYLKFKLLYTGSGKTEMKYDGSFGLLSNLEAPLPIFIFAHNS